MRCPAVFRAATVVRPGPTPKINRLVGLAGRTSATFGSATNTFAAAAGNVIIWPEPDSIVSVP
jgi:hypothetical protein